MPKRKRGRPAKPMPDAIPDTPENIAKALLFSPPKDGDGWEYLKGSEVSGAQGPREKQRTDNECNQ